MDWRRNAEKALRMLNNNRCHGHEVIYELADTSLLPDDLDKKSPVNMVHSIALK